MTKNALEACPEEGVGMKLISERYLHGRMWFLSTAEGTTFYAEYPIALAR